MESARLRQKIIWRALHKGKRRASRHGATAGGNQRRKRWVRQGGRSRRGFGQVAHVLLSPLFPVSTSSLLPSAHLFCGPHVGRPGSALPVAWPSRALSPLLTLVPLPSCAPAYLGCPAAGRAGAEGASDTADEGEPRELAVEERKEEGGRGGGGGGSGGGCGQDAGAGGGHHVAAAGGAALPSAGREWRASRARRGAAGSFRRLRSRESSIGSFPRDSSIGSFPRVPSAASFPRVPSAASFPRQARAAQAAIFT